MDFYQPVLLPRHGLLLGSSSIDGNTDSHLDIDYLQPHQIENVIRTTIMLEALNTIGTFLVRVSVCLFILRLVPPMHRDFHKYTYILIAFFAVISTATFLLILLGCIPFQGFWDMQIKARCIPRSVLSITAKTQGGK